jgi:hypothetical protein
MPPKVECDSPCQGRVGYESHLLETTTKMEAKLEAAGCWIHFFVRTV